MRSATELLSGVWMPVLLLALGCLFALTLGRHLLFHPRRLCSGLRRATGRGGSPWRKLSLALAGTLGVGNITGVALAIYYGGAGAVFWMWVSALLAMLLKYAEIVLALRTRAQGAEGEAHGGAMYYMKALIGGRVGRAVALLFALLCMLASLTLGGVVQVSAATEAICGVLCVPPFLIGVAFAILVLLILWRGVRRVEAVTGVLIPVLCAGFTLLSFVAIFLRREALPGAFSAIFRGALTLRGGVAGIAGAIGSGAFRYGVARGLVSNEAGCGTSPIAHAGSEVSEPAAQGLFGMLEVFVDTVLLCTLTALVLLTSGVEPCEGSTYALRAYSAVLGCTAAPFLAASIALFALATLLCWAHYGRECLYYLTKNERIHHAFLLLSALSALLGALARPALLWEMTDLVLACMTLLNLAALFLGRGAVRVETLCFLRIQRPTTARHAAGRDP